MNITRTALLALTLQLALAASAIGATAKPVASTKSGTKSARPKVLPFIQDDYQKAVAEARARNVPLFIEAWAPW